MVRFALCGVLIAAFTCAAQAQDQARYRTQEWYESSRVQIHTRLGPPWLNRPAFFEAEKGLRSLGVQAYSRHVKTHDEGPWWPTAVGAPADFARTRNVAKEIVDRAHANGLHVIPYYWMMTEASLSDAHPDWLAREPNGSPVEHSRGKYLCMNTPYREVVKKRLAELAGMGADGIFFDERHNPPDGCWCAACKNKFRSETGLDLPKTKNLADPAYRALIGFYNRTIEGLFRELEDAIHGANPKTQLVVSVTFVPGLWNPRMTTEFVRLVDSAKSEFALGVNLARAIFQANKGLAPPPRDVQMSLAYTLLRDASEGRPPHIWVARLTREKELMGASAALLTYGCIANLDMQEASIPNREFASSVALGNKVGPALAYSSPLRWAAVHFPERARGARLPDLTRVWNEVISPLTNAFQAFSRARVPVGIVTDGQLERGELGGYKVLVLPVAEELTASQRKTVEAFRKSGGSVIQPGEVHGTLDAAPVRVAGGPAVLHAVPYTSRDGKTTLVAISQDFSWIEQPTREGVRKASPKEGNRPASGVEVVIRGRAPRRAVEVVSGKELPIASSGTEGARVRVPDFEYMALVALER